MTPREQKIVNNFKQLQESNMHDWIYGDNNSGKFNWVAHFEKDKSKMDEIINDIDSIIDSHNVPELDNLNASQKMFHVLGYIPRDSEFTYPMNCFLYHYIKKHIPQAQLEIQPDGSILGSIKNENSNKNICLNAHMDLINIDRQNRDRIWYGAFGKNCEYYYEKDKKDSNKIFLKRKNPKIPLGADDGKGIATILNVFKNFNKNTMPNLTFFLSTVEENDLYSMKHFVKKEQNVKKLFPDNLENLAFLNFDAFEGKEIDLYSGQDLNLKDLENQLINIHKKYVENDLKQECSQNRCWIDPISDAYSLKMWINRLKAQNKLKDFNHPLLVSLNPTSLSPHSIKETIDIVEFGKFQDYVQKQLLPFLNKYQMKKLSQDEIQELELKSYENKIKILNDSLNTQKEKADKIKNPQLKEKVR